MHGKPVRGELVESWNGKQLFDRSPLRLTPPVGFVLWSQACSKGCRPT